MDCRMHCNICGGNQFADFGRRVNIRCASCGSLERQRATWLFIDGLRLLQPGMRVMHIAPEQGLSARLRALVGDALYETYDANPAWYRASRTRQLDLIADAERLLSRHYDLVVHSHVLEHLAGNITAVLFHLHRSLTEGGFHVFSVPIVAGRYEASFGDIPPEERERRFGKRDHMHLFGRDDIRATLGMVFPMPEDYDLQRLFPGVDFDEINIPPYARTGLTPHTVLCMRKGDIKLAERPL
ncbi:MAG: methyltransferase domain-containing protein [Propylenella sp.]